MSGWRLFKPRYEALWPLLLILVKWDKSLCHAAKCSVNHITADNITANTAVILWSTNNCDSGEVSAYNVTVDHTKWLACISNEKDSLVYKNYQALISRSSLSRLYPWSEYAVEVKALDRKGRLIDTKKFSFKTKMDVPSTRPKVGHSAQSLSSPQQGSISFRWEGSDQSECRFQNGLSDGYRIELIGLDPWHKGTILSSKNIQGNFYYAVDLKPFTSYMLRVYNRNVDDLVNMSNYLELQERTLSTVAEPPINFSVKLIPPTSVFLNWNPAYPRTGLVDKYQIREGRYKGSSEDPIWTRPIAVPASHNNSCPHTRQDEPFRQNIRICYVIDNLDPGTKYAFAVRTWNKNVEEEPVWSDELAVTTEAVHHPDTDHVFENETVNTDSRYGDIALKDNGGDTGLTSTSSLAIGLSLAFLIILLGLGVGAVVIYKSKTKKLKKRLRDFQSSSNLSSVYNSPPRSSIQSGQYPDCTSRSWRIQSRRLPDPPAKNASVHQTDCSSFHELTASVPPQDRHSPHQATGYLDMSGSGSEFTDIDGYLKPTFRRIDASTGKFLNSFEGGSCDGDPSAPSHSSAAHEESGPEGETSFILPDSYGYVEPDRSAGNNRPRQIPQRDASQQPDPRSPSEELFLSRSVDI